VTESTDDDRLWEQYGRLLDEYRFQVDLNWKRSQYFFVLNVALLVAAVGLLSAEGAERGLVAAVFGVGVLLALISIFANHAQHGYYRNARQAKGRIEKQLGLGDFAIATTPGMRADRRGARESKLSRLKRVRHALTGMLIALAAIDLSGFIVALT
jgi:hypothetical protein